jgi:hypothetical protein
VVPISLAKGDNLQYGDELDFSDVPFNCFLDIGLGRDLESFNYNPESSDLDFFASELEQPGNPPGLPPNLPAPAIKTWPSDSNTPSSVSSSQNPYHRLIPPSCSLEGLDSRSPLVSGQQKGKRKSGTQAELQKTKRLRSGKTNPCIRCKIYHESVRPDFLAVGSVSTNSLKCDELTPCGRCRAVYLSARIFREPCNRDPLSGIITFRAGQIASP